MRKRSIMAAGLVLFLFSCKCNNTNPVTTTTPDSTRQKDSLAFGDKAWISHGLEGKIYFLAENTSQLPQLDTMKVQGTIYTKTIDVPERSWSNGFPGVSDRFEWFAIEYQGRFRPAKAGQYTFRLASDDGSKLYIDDSLVVNNDGLHGVSSATGVMNLDDSYHDLKLQYFQGPRYYVALQLFAHLDKEEEQIFPGNYFALSTPGAHSRMIWLAAAAILLLVVLWALFSRRKKQKQ